MLHMCALIEGKECMPIWPKLHYCCQQIRITHCRSFPCIDLSQLLLMSGVGHSHALRCQHALSDQYATVANANNGGAQAPLQAYIHVTPVMRNGGGCAWVAMYADIATAGGTIIDGAPRLCMWRRGAVQEMLSPCSLKRDNAVPPALARLV